MGLIKSLSAFAFFGAALYCLLTLSTIQVATNREPSSSAQEEIPDFGLGTWLSEKGKVSHAVEYALKAGYRHIDAARIYHNEKEVGEGIKNSGVDRKDIWITSKLWNTDHRPKEARKAIEATLSDLGVEYLDLYLVHWPVAFKHDGDNEVDKDTSIVETWRALEGFVKANLTRHIGISNFSPSDVKKILSEAEIKPYAHELETHPYLQQQEFIDYHADEGIKVIAYSPLANTNPTYDPDRVPSILDDPFWNALAERKNASVVQTVLAWGRERGTIVIPKSVHEKYIDQNLKSLDIHFSEDELDEVAKQDKKVRLNDPGKKWGVDLFDGLDDPTRERHRESDDDGEL